MTLPANRAVVVWRDRLACVWPDAGVASAAGVFWVDAALIVLAWVLVSLQFVRGQAFVPWDSAEFFFPQARFVAMAIHSGQAPWWNPFLYAGQPVLGDPQGMIFSPHVLVGVIAGKYFNLYLFDMTTLVTVLFGGIALARYARPYTDSRTLPMLGALVFIAGGVATSRLEHVALIVSYAMLPIQLLALRAVCLRPTIPRVMLLIAVMIIAALNPDQVTFLSVFALLPFVALHLYQSEQRPRAAVALAVAAVAALIAVLPVLSAIGEFVSLSNRPALGLDQSGASSFPFFNVSSIFLPGLYGVRSPQFGWWSPTDISQDFLYIGVIPAAVFLWSFLCLRRISAITILCWVGILISFIYAMGINTPFYPLLFEHLPGFSAFRRPADGAFFLNLFLALLIATRGLPHRMQAGPFVAAPVVGGVLVVVLGSAFAFLAMDAERVGQAASLMLVLHAFASRLTIIIAAGLMMIAIGRHTRRWLIGPLLIGLTVGDLSLAARGGTTFGSLAKGSELAQTYSGSLSWAAPRNPLEESITFLKQNGVAGDNPTGRIEALGGSLGANMPMVFGILTTQGYDPLMLRSYQIAMGGQNLQNEAKQFTTETPGYDSPDYRRMSLRYVLIHHYIADHSADFGAFGAAIGKIRAKFMGGSWARLLAVPGVYEVWEMRDPMPRASVVAQDGTETPCQITSYGTVSVSVQCHARAPGRMVLGDSYAPGWAACVNGKAVPVEPFQGIFRAVPVPVGDSQTDFHYGAVPFLRRFWSCPAP